jgi:hypothetical protein
MACVALHFALHSTNPLLAAHVLSPCANKSVIMSVNGFIGEWNFVCLAWHFARQFLVEFATVPSTTSRICTMLPGCQHSLVVSQIQWYSCALSPRNSTTPVEFWAQNQD